jgi:transposase
MSPEEELIALRQEKLVWQAEKAELQAELAEVKELLLEMTLHVKTLEERQSKDSHNSHLPPSSDRFARQKKTRSLRKRSGKKPGAQPGHKGHHLALSDTPHEVVIHRVERCAHCQADLREVAAHTVERRQQVDVPPVQAHIQEHQAERKCCPHCHQETRAPFSAEISAAVQYGEGVGAMAIWLLTQQLLPYGRTSQVLSDVLGVRLSVGTRSLVG